jgi:2-C-methyl-D-erythritol 4-phosphate cytidylyltransferase/2-C-methyl-D-erythritol 2,4-cyclodiphosphate synthase
MVQDGKKMSIAALIVAAGRGTRAGGNDPKQWQMLAGKRVIDHTLNAFKRHRNIDTILVVLHPEDQNRLTDPTIKTALGGATRNQSVYNGLRALRAAAPKQVLIHDVARPLISEKCITDVIEALQTHSGAAPALPITDALWRGQDGFVDETVSRENLFRAQTPQGFDFESIFQAHAQACGAAADDVEVAMQAGLSVKIISGHEENIKITIPEDFERASKIMKDRR